MLPPMALRYPFTGRWLTQNSPANRVPSHGTTRYATSYAIDFVPVDDSGRSARLTWRSFTHPEPPERFVGFGRPILAPVDGVVVAVHDGEPDHDAHRGLPSIRYALTQGRRAAGGWPGLAGNHVMIQVTGGAVVALCHLQKTSVSVAVGDRVVAGQTVGRCGNSGNSTEPHLHLQVLSELDVLRATAVPMALAGGLPRNGEVVVGG